MLGELLLSSEEEDEKTAFSQLSKKTKHKSESSIIVKLGRVYRPKLTRVGDKGKN